MPRNSKVAQVSSYLIRYVLPQVKVTPGIAASSSGESTPRIDECLRPVAPILRVGPKPSWDPHDHESIQQRRNFPPLRRLRNPKTGMLLFVGWLWQKKAPAPDLAIMLCVALRHEPSVALTSHMRPSSSLQFNCDSLAVPSLAPITGCTGSMTCIL